MFSDPNLDKGFHRLYWENDKARDIPESIAAVNSSFDLEEGRCFGETLLKKTSVSARTCRYWSGEILSLKVVASHFFVKSATRQVQFLHHELDIALVPG